MRPSPPEEALGTTPRAIRSRRTVLPNAGGGGTGGAGAGGGACHRVVDAVIVVRQVSQVRTCIWEQWLNI